MPDINNLRKIGYFGENQQNYEPTMSVHAYAPVICDYASLTLVGWGGGRSRTNLPCFHFDIVPTVGGKFQRFDIHTNMAVCGL